MPSVDPPALRGAARAPRCCGNPASCKMLSMENWRDTRHNRRASAVPELCRYPWPLLTITARDARNVTRTCHVTAFALCAVKQMRQAPSGMNDRINGHRKDRSRRHAPRAADWSADGRYFSSAYLRSSTDAGQRNGQHATRWNRPTGLRQIWPSLVHARGTRRKDSPIANRSFLQILSLCLWISLAIALPALGLALMALLVLP